MPSLHESIKTAKPTYIVRILVLLFLLFSSIAAFHIYGQFNRTLDQAEAKDQAIARMTSKLLEEHEENVLVTLEAYALRHLLIDSIESRAVVETRRHLAELKNSTEEIDLTFVTDEKGVLWVNYPEFPEAIGSNLSDRDWYKGVSSSWQPYVSSAFHLVLGDKPLAVCSAVPVFNLQGQVVGIIAESSRLTTIETLLDGSQQYGSVFVLDRVGNIIYDSRQHDLRQITAYPLQTEVRHILESGQKNGEISDQHDGRKKKFLTVAHNDIGWTVVIERTLAETLRHEYIRYFRTVAISFLSFLLIAGFIFYQRSLHEKTLSLNDELERRVEQRTLELQETQAKYLHAEKLSAIGKLSASISHEFNNPLMAVLTILRGLQKSANLTEEERHFLQAAIEAAERMTNLMRNLRDFNKPSSGQKVLMDVHAALDSILLLCRSDFKKKHIATVLHYAEQLPQIMAIPDQIKQVFLNLLNNAADACSETGKVITISTNFDGRRVALTFHDNGIGIDPEKIDQIFQPFYTTKSEAKGTGLGLSISHGIVQNHQGEIRVESEPDKGSTFTVLLPIAGKNS